MKVKQSFGHKGIISSNQKTSFTKIAQFGMLFESVSWNVKVKLSFGHKTVISSLSKLNIKSKNFFDKSCSIWYAVWDYHIKSECHFVNLYTKHLIKKNYFCISCSVWSVIWGCGIKSESLAAILSLFKLCIK